MKTIIAFVGMPGSGKSTIAKEVAAREGWPYISTGDIARKLAEDDPLTDGMLTLGAFAPEKAMRHAVTEAIINSNSSMIVLDGMPRKPVQVEYLERLGNAVYIHIDVPNELAIDRLLARGRDDDQILTIEHRMYQYIRHTRKAIQLAEQVATVHFIDGSKPVGDVIETALHIVRGEMNR